MKFTAQSGFTLVELMIVLVIIAIVVAITSMSVLAARVQANEGQAKAALNAIASAVEMYRNTQGVYPDSLTILGSDYVGPDLVAGQKSGYAFAAAAGTSTDLQLTATGTPSVSTGATQTGARFFFTDETQVVRFAVGAAATSTSGAIGN